MRSLAQARTPVPLSAGSNAGLFSGPWQDLRYAVRTIRQQPGFAAVVVATLALGIAVNTLTFTIVNAAVLRPLPFEDPDQLVRLSVANDDAQNPVANPSYLEVLDWQQARRTFEHIAVLAERRMDLSGDRATTCAGGDGVRILEPGSTCCGSGQPLDARSRLRTIVPALHRSC